MKTSQDNLRERASHKVDFSINGETWQFVSPDLQMLRASLKRFADHQRYVAFFREILSDVRRVVDVGACLGTYSLLFHWAWPDAEIIALEPSGHNYPYLLQNTLHIPPIRQYQLAAHDKTETLILAIPSMEQKSFLNMGEENCGIISVYGESDILRGPSLAVRVDELVDYADFIKIDVEGHDFVVLQGCERLLKESAPVIMIEFIDSNFILGKTSPQDILDYLGRFGYSMVGQVNQDIFFSPKSRLPAGYVPEDLVLRKINEQYKLGRR